MRQFNDRERLISLLWMTSERFSNGEFFSREKSFCTKETGLVSICDEDVSVLNHEAFLCSTIYIYTFQGYQYT